MTTRYRIQIHADGKLLRSYRTTGAISITASQRPMFDAAKALISRGADPDATLAGSFEGNAISAVSLARLVRAYTPPRVSHRAADPSRNLD